MARSGHTLRDSGSALRGLALVLSFLLALSVCVACKRTPKCAGELDRDDLLRLQELAADDKYPCPEHLEPSIEVRPKGVRLNGKLVATEAALPIGKARRINGLFGALKQNRETWKQSHPGQSFDARPKLDIDPMCDFGTGAAALMTTAYAGYPNLRFRSGGIELELYYDVPGPPRPDADDFAPTELWVTRNDSGRYLAQVKQNSVLVQTSEQALGIDAAASWVATRCAGPGGRCANVIVLGSNGEFLGAATLLHLLLKTPPFKARPPTVRFVTDG